ncbi:MAG: tetratricopeptide repeat protein [Gemmatimonadota bacterium]
MKGFGLSARIGLSARRWVALGTVAALPLLGCGGSGEETLPAQEGQEVSQPLSDQAQLLVNQGNTAQREGRYAEALDFFGQALDIHPNHPVPQFGSLMAAMAVGDTALARSLREKLEVTGPDLLAMLGPEGGMGDTAPATPGASHLPEGAMPPDHPTVENVPPDTVRPEAGRRG